MYFCGSHVPPGKADKVELQREAPPLLSIRSISGIITCSIVGIQTNYSEKDNTGTVSYATFLYLFILQGMLWYRYHRDSLLLSLPLNDGTEKCDKVVYMVIKSKAFALHPYIVPHLCHLFIIFELFT